MKKICRMKLYRSRNSWRICLFIHVFSSFKKPMPSMDRCICRPTLIECRLYLCCKRNRSSTLYGTIKEKCFMIFRCYIFYNTCMLIFLMTGLTGAGSFIRLINEKLILNFWQIMNVTNSLIYATRYKIFVSGHFGKKKRRKY